MKQRKLYIFLVLAIFLFPICFSFTSHAASSKNAYLVPLFDEQTCSYKYKVIVSGEPLEYSHVSALLPIKNTKKKDGTTAKKHVLRIQDSDPKWYIYGLDLAVKKDDKRDVESRVTLNSDGRVSIIVAKDGKEIDDWSKISGVTEDDCMPLTFPAPVRNYKESDQVRAQEIADELGGDFNDALLYINGGSHYRDPVYFHQMALALLSTASGSHLTNGYGSTYRIDWKSDDDSDYAKYVTITPMKNDKIGEPQVFMYKVKKGYKGCFVDDVMENGRRNNIGDLTSEQRKKCVDTVWVSWEHLFLEAEMLNCEGITYHNVGDLYAENSSLHLVRNTLNASLTSLLSDLSIRKAQDIVFNQDAYGSGEYCYGAYKDSSNKIVFPMFLAFTAIMVSLLSISIIKIINERQTVATYSSMSRANLLKQAQDLLMCLFAIAFVWQIVKILLMLNFYFVRIWGAFLAENGSYAYMNATVGYNTLIQLAIIIVYIYFDVIYVLRSIFIPILIATSPIFLFLYTLGGNYQRVTKAWFKELLGAIFMQSIHAFVLCFVMLTAQETSGVTQVVVWACVIPITKMFRDMCGLGGKELFSLAKNLTASTVSTAGSVMDATGQVASAGLGAFGAVQGATMGAARDLANKEKGVVTNLASSYANVGQNLGQMVGRGVGGASRSMFGAGAALASGGEMGQGDIVGGMRTYGYGVAQGINSVGTMKKNNIVNAPSQMSPQQRMSQTNNALRNNPASFQVTRTADGRTLGVADFLNRSSQESIMDLPNGQQYVTNTVNTGMSLADAKARYSTEGLGTQTLASLAPENAVAKLLVDTHAYQSVLPKSGASMSDQVQQSIIQNYQNNCQALGVSSMQLGKSNSATSTAPVLVLEGTKRS